jgi:5S rRNA maturation endonuclease (ribonuclease M5)
MLMTAGEFAKRLEARQSGQGWIARCPAHEDRRASLSISPGRDDRVLLKCHAGCPTEAVVAALGLHLSDLMPSQPSAQGRIVATYDYHNPAGAVLYQVVRREPKEFRQRRPDGNGGWIWDMRGVNRVIYRLPEIIQATITNDVLYIVEGEKDADAMWQHGLPATCNAGGALKWADAYSDVLRGCRVIVIADKDTAGRRHAQQVLASLARHDCQASVLELPDINGRQVKDAHDFFAAGGTAADVQSLSAEIASRSDVSDLDGVLIPSEPETPAAEAASQAGATLQRPLPPVDNAASLVADRQLTVPPEIIHGVLHRGLKGVIGSVSKARKSWILLDLALSVATGQPWWGWGTTQGRVLLVNFEIPRAFMRSRIASVAATKQIEDLRNLDVWTLRGHAAPFYRILPEMVSATRSGGYSLVIIDPVYKGFGAERDENTARDVGAVVEELERIATDTGAAIVVSAHYAKGQSASKEVVDRISGSGVWARDTDALICLTPHMTPGAYAVELVLRNVPEQPPFVVEWKYPLMVKRDDLNPEDLKQAKKNGQPAKPAQPATEESIIGKLLGLFAVGKHHRKCSVRTWFRRLDVGRDTLREVIELAIDAGTLREYVKRDGRSQIRWLTRGTAGKNQSSDEDVPPTNDTHP